MQPAPPWAKLRNVWSIRVRLQVERGARNLALFNLAIDSKLRGCDLVRLQVDDVRDGPSNVCSTRLIGATDATGRGATSIWSVPPVKLLSR
jgi:hypothetical protein